MLDKVKGFLEYCGFGVCQYLGEKMGIKSSLVRLHFIYLTFIALGSPLFVYLIVAFWINIKKYIRRGVSVLAD